MEDLISFEEIDEAFSAQAQTDFRGMHDAHLIDLLGDLKDPKLGGDALVTPILDHSPRSASTLDHVSSSNGPEASRHAPDSYSDASYSDKNLSDHSLLRQLDGTERASSSPASDLDVDNGLGTHGQVTHFDGEDSKNYSVGLPTETGSDDDTFNNDHDAAPCVIPGKIVSPLEHDPLPGDTHNLEKSQDNCKHLENHTHGKQVVKEDNKDQPTNQSLDDIPIFSDNGFHSESSPLSHEVAILVKTPLASDASKEVTGQYEHKLPEYQSIFGDVAPASQPQIPSDTEGRIVELDLIGDDSGNGSTSEGEDETDKYRLTVFPDRPKNITEKKRLEAAAFSSWMIQKQQDVANAAAMAGPSIQDSSSFTVARMLDDSGSKKIIATPREYQIDLFERAKGRNTIVVLDTGSGKTLIAALLLRHTMEQELESRALGKPKKVAFFLVEKVALCLQQYMVLSSNLEYPVTRVHGAMAEVVNTKEYWETLFSDNMVLVCTAQVLLDCLTNGFIQMNGINLLILDEAHHTKKNHPYAKIMKYHYLREREERPRILGMTASPVDGKFRDARAVAEELETMLCSEIATVSNEVLNEQLARRMQTERIEMYKQLEPEETCRTGLWHGIMRLDVASCHREFVAALAFTSQAASTLGSWCADRWWKLAMTDAAVVRLEGLANGLPSQMNQAVSLPRIVQRLVQDHRMGPIYPDTNELSPKVNALFHTLNDAFCKGADRCIVFVEKRSTAALLSDLFSQPSMAIPGMVPAYMVGSQSIGFNLGHMTFRDQLLALNKFRRGKTNCLFATPVAEEGIDVPECDVIIRFDLFNSVIQYIQSKGRARQAVSMYVSMVEHGNQHDKRRILQAARDSQALRQFCASLPVDRKLEDEQVLTVADYEFAAQTAHDIPSTGARLTLAGSLEVLARFTSSLPVSGGYSRGDFFITSLGKRFVASLILPDASPIKHVSGHPQQSKHLARCSAAYEACIQLHEKKYINDNLQPMFTKKINKMRNARLAISTNKKSEYPMRTKPELWTLQSTEVPAELYAHAIVLRDPGATERPSRPLMLLTRSPLPGLPDIPLHFGNGQCTRAYLTKPDSPLRISADEIKGLRNFTLKVFADVFSKQFEASAGELPYFIGPSLASYEGLLSGGAECIDWDIVRSVAKQEFLSWEDQPDPFFNAKLIVDRNDGSRKLITRGINKELRPSDLTPQGVPEPKCRPYRMLPPEQKTIKEYSCSLWTAARKRHQWRNDQPVVNAEILPLRRNLLDEDSAEIHDQRPRDCFIILEPLQISPLPLDIVTAATLMPAILHRLEAALISLDVCKALGLDLRPDLALEAMTKDSDNTEEHDAEQLNFQRGMGNNYERLEFLGDSFLKMATTISLFTLMPENDEAQNHDERMLLVCNQNLFNHAVDRQLYEYVRSKSFDRGTWYPDLKVLKGKVRDLSSTRHKLSDKTIADVCEAIIGAAYLTGEGDLDMAVQAVTCMVKSKYHTMHSYKDYYKAWKVPEWQTAEAPAAHRFAVDQIAEAIGYRFKSPNMLRSAFKHPSYPYEKIPHYQRLEFLGDALLDMTIVDYLFRTFPGTDPQWLTEHKMAMASNQFLGCLCVKLGLHKHLLTTTSALIGLVAQYIAELDLAEKEAVSESKGAARKDYWLSASHPPKALPDIVEALVGAMFVDSGYDYSVVQRFFGMHVKPYFEDMNLYDTFANKHPVTALGRRLAELHCRRWRLCCSTVPGMAGDVASVMNDRNGDVICALMVHEKVLADCMGKSGRYGKIRLAKMALEKYAGWDVKMWREETGCDCEMDGEDLEDHGTAV
ncbi:hypothetical protein S40293_04968 [Stachybotrys chartarum IBT 40293]|nr:hypothetical protein S40293_04968 [Stachybotrys chartarum IBT 40293]